jgi:hypothetical protein
VADAAYYYGDHVPNFAQLRSSDPARVGAGYDYDVITEEVLLTRMSVKDGRLVLPDGMSYAVLVLPDRPVISLPALRKVKALIEAGATVCGPRPATAPTLQGYPENDAEVGRLAAGIWGGDPASETAPRTLGSGRIFPAASARTALTTAGILPDFEFQGADAQTTLDWIHRRADGADLYFVANRSNRAERVTASFRVAGRAPELWNPVTGDRTWAAACTAEGGRTTVPLEFPPYGSWFVVFRSPGPKPSPTAEINASVIETLSELGGPWSVHFPVGMSAAERDESEMLKSSSREVVLDSLRSWTEHDEPGIKYYSGAATYQRNFDLPAGIQSQGSGIGNGKWEMGSQESGIPDHPSSSRLWLDLGEVRELAEVWLNGRSLGIVWAPPFRVDITDVVKPTGNLLQVEVVNFWPNRIIGDQFLPPEKRFTRTNVRKLTKETPLMPSGLLGPVRLLSDRVPETSPSTKPTP